MVNVPTVLWIDENGRIVRPNDVAFTSEAGGRYANVSTRAQMTLLRRWVHDELPATPPADLRSLQQLPTDDDQLARAEFGLGNHLWRTGRQQAAARAFDRAGALAPHDFIIRRGTMPMLNKDPFGDDFRAMVKDWRDRGHAYYNPLPVEPPED
jgi:hypothetical protein